MWTAVQPHHGQVPGPHPACSTQETPFFPGPQARSSVPSTFTSHSLCLPIPWQAMNNEWIKACLPFTLGESAVGGVASREHQASLGKTPLQARRRASPQPACCVRLSCEHAVGEGCSKPCCSSPHPQTSAPKAWCLQPCTAGACSPLGTASGCLHAEQTLQAAAYPAEPNRLAPPAALREFDPKSVC